MRLITLLSATAVTLFATATDFSTLLDKTLKNNKSLQAKRLNSDIAKTSYHEALGHNYGKLSFQETISHTNNPLHVFGMKLSSGEASFRDFGFSEFLAPLGMMMNGMAVDQNELLNTTPKDLNEPDPRTNYETLLQYEIPLFTGFKLSSAKAITEMGMQVSEHDFERQQHHLELEVLSAYNGVVASKYFIDAVSKAKEATTQFVRISQDLHGAGMVTKTDVLEAKQRDAKIDAMMIEAKNNYELGLSYLRFLSDDAGIDGVNGFSTVESGKSTLTLLQEEALKERADFKAMKLNVKRADKGIDYHSANDYPMVGAFAQVGRNGESLGDGQDYYLVGARLSYEIYGGGVSSAQKERARIQYNQAKLYESYMQEGIKLEVEKCYKTLQALKAEIEQKRQSKNLAEEVLEKSQIAYQNGLTTITMLLLKEAEALEARARLIKADYDASLASAKLLIATGKSLRKDNQ